MLSWGAPIYATFSLSIHLMMDACSGYFHVFSTLLHFYTKGSGIFSTLLCLYFFHFSSSFVYVLMHRELSVSFLWLPSIPLCGHVRIYLPSPLWVDIWVIFKLLPS